MYTRRPFEKQALTVRQLIEKYKERGLIIEDEERAKHYLTYISYYRLGPYFRFFQRSLTDKNHIYKDGTTFEDGLRLYIFDRELRLLFIDALERVEVSVRAAISNHMALRHGISWYTNPKHFDSKIFNHRRFVSEIEEAIGLNVPDAQPMFARHYFNTYCEPRLPPSWMIAEVLSLGTWSKIYGALRDGSDALAIARIFGPERPTILASYLYRLTLLRNICAHHALLFCRTFPGTDPIFLEGGGQLTETSSVFAMATLVHKFLKMIAPGSGWAVRLRDLLARHPECSGVMAFKFNWHKKPFWGICENAAATA